MPRIALVAEDGRNVSLAEAAREETPSSEAGFDWQQHDDDASMPDVVRTMGSAASLQWIAKARSERRRRAARNAAGWLATMVVGGLILGGAAFLLTGWRPDFAALVAMAQRAAS